MSVYVMSLTYVYGSLTRDDIGREGGELLHLQCGEVLDGEASRGALLIGTSDGGSSSDLKEAVMVGRVIL